MDNDAKHDQGEYFDLFQLLILLTTISSQHRSAAGVVQLLGKMYALGGHNGLSIFDSVEEYDTQTECWAETVPMLSKRCRLGVSYRVLPLSSYSQQLKCNVPTLCNSSNKQLTTATRWQHWVGRSTRVEAMTARPSSDLWSALTLLPASE